MNDDRHQGQDGEMTRQEAAEMIAQRLGEHEQDLSRLAAQFAGLQRVRNDLQDLRDEVRAAAAGGGLAGAIGAIASPGRAPSAHERAIAQTAHEVAAAALASVPRHGGATAAGIGLRHEDGWLTVAVGDNGPRAALAEADDALARLETRVRALDGQLTRFSTPDEGTTVVVGLPLRRSG